MFSKNSIRFALVALTLTLVLSGSASAANHADQIIKDVNTLRVSQGLAPLSSSSQLGTAALAHARNMANNQESSHQINGWGPAERLKAVGYSWAHYVQCIQWVKTSDSPATAVLGKWLTSPNNRNALLRADVTEIGVAYATSSNGTIFFCLIAADRKPE
jgi:uncharacterized protein YkwD